jgi:predicted aconitase with swiveling domain
MPRSAPLEKCLLSDGRGRTCWEDSDVSEIPVQCVSAGEVEATLIVSPEPLSLWGGFSVTTGAVIDRSHPAFGRILTGCILAMPSGRGSSSSSSILAEALRLGTAPAGLVLAETDPILAVGEIVARKLYGKSLPIVVCGRDALAHLQADQRYRISAKDTDRSFLIFSGSRHLS